MSRRPPQLRRLNVHRNYTKDEVARARGVHPNTVGNWIKDGLEVCDGMRPTLIRGGALHAYLDQRSVKAKRPCGPGQLYCFRCRSPRPPADETLEFEPLNRTSGTLVALCATCGTLMYRCVRLADLDRVRGDFEVTVRGGQRHISKTQ